MVSIATGLRFFVVVSTAILQLVHCNPVDDSLIGSRIVGGRIINISQAPYQVSIRDSAGYTFCGGSIISTRHILTAAHCFRNHAPLESNVVYGALKRTDQGTKVNVEKISQYFLYSTPETGNDVAVLKLVSLIKLSSTAEIIKLVQNEPDQTGITLTVTGWGATEEGGQGSNSLRAAKVLLVSRKDCEHAYRNTGFVIDQTMICAAAEQRDTCQGDSGGPLVRTVNGERRQVGIVSWGIGCARPEYPGVYTNVARFITFINHVVNNS